MCWSMVGEPGFEGVRQVALEEEETIHDRSGKGRCNAIGEY